MQSFFSIFFVFDCFLMFCGSKWQQMAAIIHLLPYINILTHNRLTYIMAAMEAKFKKLFHDAYKNR